MWDVENIQACGSCRTAGGELEISDELFSRFTGLIYSVAGIRLGPGKKILVTSRLMRRVKALELEGLTEYFHRVKEDEQELVEMLNCISTNTTNFFRENHHFEFLKGRVIPELLQSRKDERGIRIWSAGCSTGEEPYSIALTVCETLQGLRPHGFWDTKILATDISTKVLNAAAAGIYLLEQFPETVGEALLKKYFLKGNNGSSDSIRVKDNVKNLIRFRKLNLKEKTYPFKKTFDVIFCRNVMIYFDDDMKRHVLSMYHKHLADDGYLFLGHSESMVGQEKFRPVHITTYKKN
ncbi:MAG: methyltransferase domain-containing protein [Nitrospirae bacterium]|nr:MAG: methyltransferase domain-containing protein [Nitrospirota bacterium]